MKLDNNELLKKEAEVIKLMSNLTQEEWAMLCTNMSKVGLSVAEVQRSVSMFAEVLNGKTKIKVVL